MKPMYFELCHNPENKTLAIPRAALQLSGLADAEELILLTGGDMSWWHETRLVSWMSAPHADGEDPRISNGSMSRLRLKHFILEENDYEILCTP